MHSNPTPFNRYILVLKEERKKDNESLVLVPDEYKNVEAFTVVNIVKSSVDCKEVWPQGRKVIVPTHAIETLPYNGEEYHLVSESHILLGFVADIGSE